MKLLNILPPHEDISLLESFQVKVKHFSSWMKERFISSTFSNIDCCFSYHLDHCMLPNCGAHLFVSSVAPLIHMATQLQSFSKYTAWHWLILITVLHRASVSELYFPFSSIRYCSLLVFPSKGSVLNVVTTKMECVIKSKPSLLLSHINDILNLGKVLKTWHLL